MFEMNVLLRTDLVICAYPKKYSENRYVRDIIQPSNCSGYHVSLMLLEAFPSYENTRQKSA